VRKAFAIARLGVLLGLLSASFSGSCRVTETESPVYVENAGIRRAKPSRIWSVVTEDGVVGEVVYCVSTGRPEDSFYMVRNLWQQDLGLIDSLGRAYRYVPHRSEPAWVVTGTVAQGAAGILLLAGECDLIEEEGFSEPRAGTPPGDGERPR